MKNSLKTMLLMTVMGGLAIGIGAIFGTSGIIIGGVIAFLIVGVSYWFCDKIAIASARAVPAEREEHPKYFEIMEELSEKAGIPMPALYITPNPQPNAFATGRNPAKGVVAVTQGLLDNLSWDEIRGVLAHEFMHIKNRDILVGSVAAAIAMAITLIARIALWGSLLFGRRDGNIIGILLMGILAPLAAMLIQMAISRSREFKADQTAAQLINDGEPLASALEKLQLYSKKVPALVAEGKVVSREQASHYIVNPLAFDPTSHASDDGGEKELGGLARMFSTHPVTSERIRRLREGEWRAL